MTSELDAIAAGVRFTRSMTDGRVSAAGPKEFDLRAAVVERLEMVKTRFAGGPSMDGGKRWGQCDSCGGAMESHRGGNCWLCCCAMQKLRDQKKAVDTSVQ